MTRAEALAALRAGHTPLAPGQKVQARLFRPEDAPGVARLFHQVYGESYPVDEPYVPELLAEANRTGRIRTIVAAGPEGDIIGQSAFYQSSPPNKRLYEYGQMLVDKDYRGSFAAARMHHFALRNMFGCMDGVDGVFGEAVCHHTMTQKISHGAQALECGLELGLMPEAAYAAEGAAGRVSCLLHVRVDAGGEGPLYLPECWAPQIRAILPQWTLTREFRPAGPGTPPPAEALTEMEVQRFDFAGVTRLNVARLGADFAARLAGELARAEADGHALVQVFLCLGEPWAGDAAEALRSSGFFFAGLLPLWFGATAPGPDALLAQRLLAPARLCWLVLHEPMGERLRDLVLEDLARAVRDFASPGVEILQRPAEGRP